MTESDERLHDLICALNGMPNRDVKDYPILKLTASAEITEDFTYTITTEDGK